MENLKDYTMKTLKDYEELIRETVREMDAKDPNWRWSVHSVEGDKVMIRWGYLDYCEEKSPFFSLTASTTNDVDYPGENWLTARDHSGEHIEGTFVTHVEAKHSWQVSWETGIKSMLSEMDYYAHSRY